MISLFKCRTFGSNLRPAACGKRHELALRGGRASKNESAFDGHERCAACSVGASYARGETPATWDDGTPVELVTLALPAPRSTPKPAPSPLPAAPRSAPRVVEPEKESHGSEADRVGSPRASAPRVDDAQSAEAPCDGEEAAHPEADQARASAGEVATAEAKAEAQPMSRRGCESPARSTAQAGRRGMREGKRYQWGDRNLTVAEWAQEPEAREHGLSANAIQQRLRKDPSIERAVTTPKYAGCTPPKRATAEDAAAPTARAPRSNGEAIVERLNAIFVPRDTSGPVVLLEAAGYRVVSSTRVPAGLALIVEEGSR